MKLGFSALLLLSLLGGCALMDTGEVEYRRAELPDRIPRGAIANTRPSAANADCLEVPARYREANRQQNRDETRRRGRGEPPDLGAGYRRWACYPLVPARLVRRNASVGDAIRPNQYYSIRIDHGVIADIIETPFSFRRLLSARNPVRRVGEIVILANTFEFAAPGENGASPNFANLSNLTGVKVVYYNPDVEEGQALSFSNIPISEGRQYGGRPIGIQIVVLELDRMSGPMRSLMRTLAQIGQESAALPSGIVSQTLLDLGASLISQDNDDVMFEYRFVLDRAENPNQTAVPAFEAGRYVLRRTRERRRVARWDDLLLDHNTGELMQLQADGQATGRYLPFDRDTYLTLNIVRHDQSGQFAFNPQTLQQLGEEISTAAAQRDQAIGEVTSRLAASVVQTRNRQIGAELVEAWRAAAGSYREYAELFEVRSVLDATDATCVERPDPNRVRQRSERLFQARIAAMNFVSLYNAALAERDRHGLEIKPATPGGAQPPNPLFDDQIQLAVLTSLSAYYTPFDVITAAVLSDPAQFRTTYTGTNGPAFAQSAQDAAERHWAPATCAAMIEAGLADQRPPAPVPPPAPPAQAPGTKPETPADAPRRDVDDEPIEEGDAPHQAG